MIGGVEAGGTSFRCAIGSDPRNILADVTIPTTQASETLSAVIDFFRSHDSISHLGIASFGPLNLDPASPDFGAIRDTPKLAWQGFPIRSELIQALDVPTAIDTDVAAAAMAEHQFGSGQGMDSLIYITVGTGVGGAYLVRGLTAPALIHPEMGHMLVPRAAEDRFAGSCPFHGDCVEGMASATALRARWKTEPHELKAEHPAWAIEAWYLAALCQNLSRTIAPQRILLGGGVMRATGLMDSIRERFAEMMAGYHSIPEAGIKNLIRAPALEPNAGLTGALCLADRLRRQCVETP